MPVQGTPMYRVVEKLKNVKYKLKILHRTEYERIFERVKQKKAELDVVQTNLSLGAGKGAEA